MKAIKKMDCLLLALSFGGVLGLASTACRSEAMSDKPAQSALQAESEPASSVATVAPASPLASALPSATGASSGTPGATLPTSAASSAPAEAQAPGRVQIANPSAGYCIEHGGKLESIETPEGTDAVCVFSDGTRCGAWPFFRGECKPGKCRDKMGACKEGSK